MVLQKTFWQLHQKFIIKRCKSFRPKSAWHLEVEIILTSFNNIYIISLEQFYEKKRFITKSSDDRSDFTSGHASKSYINEGIHLLDNSCNRTSSLAILATFPKIAFAER